eukprot:TRINITY_DN2462_c0_g1_i1.p1 TRINITY_DN2462_c0_g1~~TRINITY_DN2462_c0_g1_i1.p1  ORF type:complete len:429 (-),score=98.64 TRINITY_DN2462_c0_g1_i1:15-1262(-)
MELLEREYQKWRASRALWQPVGISKGQVVRTNMGSFRWVKEGDPLPVCRGGSGTKFLVIAVDVQYDFAHPGGSLYLKDSDVTVHNIQLYLQHLSPERCAGVLYTLDTHYQDTYAQTEESAQYPMHCVENSVGWSLVVDPKEVDGSIGKWYLKKEFFSMWRQPSEEVMVKVLPSEGLYVGAHSPPFVECDHEKNYLVYEEGRRELSGGTLKEMLCDPLNLEQHPSGEALTQEQRPSGGTLKEHLYNPPNQEQYTSGEALNQQQRPSGGTLKEHLYNPPNQEQYTSGEALNQQQRPSGGTLKEHLYNPLNQEQHQNHPLLHFRQPLQESYRDQFFKDLKSEGIETIEVIGFASDVCVSYAILGLLERGFVVHVDPSLVAGVQDTIHDVKQRHEFSHHSHNFKIRKLIHHHLIHSHKT